MNATILDVAKICGYSKATVSRAFAEPEHVSEKAREKIYAAAKALHYTPNAIARAMVTRRTDNLAFIIYEQQYPVVLNPFYSPIFEAVLQTATRNGYSLFISSDKDMRLPNGDFYMKKQMDGVILAGKTDTDTVLGLKKNGIPVVLLNNQMELADIPCITAEQYRGAEQAVHHLIERGHRRIGLIAGKFSPHIYSNRLNAYLDVLSRNGIAVDYRYIQTIEPTMEEATACASAMISLEQAPTALFCTNDTIAVGAIKTALRRGMRVPDDIAIVGYDDSDISRIIEPELTTVHVDKSEMGRIAAETLIDLIEGKSPERLLFETKTELIVRKST